VTTSAIDVRVFDSLESCAHLRADMARLNEASSRPCPFSTFEFLANHVQHNAAPSAAHGPQVLFLTAFRDRTLIGYMPLRRVADQLFGRTRQKIEYLVTQDIDRPHLVARQADTKPCAEAFCRYLLEAESDWTFLELVQQDEASALYPLPPSLDPSEVYARLYENASNATIPIVYRSLGDYFRAFSKKMRSNVGRYARRLFEAGDVEVVSSSAPAALPGLLDVYRSVELLSWKSGIDGVVGGDPGRIDYFRGLIQPHQPMRVSIRLLTLDGCPIAGIINGRFVDGMYALQIAYDEAFFDLDPGAMMLLVSMKEAIDGRCAFYDLLSGYGYYKERWLARMTPSRSVQVYRTGSLHHLKAILGEYKRHILGNNDPQVTAQRNLAKEAATDRRVPAVDSGAADRQRGDSTRLLAELRASGAPIDRLSHGELVDAMPFAVTG
jgi:CelD/BcsL family acetyltransferase involved in cellulose biosynthesis